MLQVVYVPQLATESLVFLTKTYLNQFQCPIFVLQNPEKSPFDPGEVPKTTAQGQHLSAVARRARRALRAPHAPLAQDVAQRGGAADRCLPWGDVPWDWWTDYYSNWLTGDQVGI